MLIGNSTKVSNGTVFKHLEFKVTPLIYLSVSGTAKIRFS